MDNFRYFYKCVDNIDILNKFCNDDSFCEWFNIVKPILETEEFQKRRLFLHHEKESLWTHSIKVSFLSFKSAKRFKLSVYDTSIGGLLHDFYVKAWQYSSELEILDKKYRENFINADKVRIKASHVFYHPLDALENSKKYFNNLLNNKINDVIIKHMFPLSIFTKYKFPKFKESWLVSAIDKYTSLNIFLHPNSIGKYIGLLNVNFK